MVCIISNDRFLNDLFKEENNTYFSFLIKKKNNVMLTSSTIVKRKEDRLLISKVDDELIMMDIDKGAYISLNSTATIIWERIKEPVKVKEIIHYLTERFGIETEKCTKETLSFLKSIDNLQGLEIYYE